MKNLYTSLKDIIGHENFFDCDEATKWIETFVGRLDKAIKECDEQDGRILEAFEAYKTYRSYRLQSDLLDIEDEVKAMQSACSNLTEQYHMMMQFKEDINGKIKNSLMQKIDAAIETCEQSPFFKK